MKGRILGFGAIALVMAFAATRPGQPDQRFDEHQPVLETGSSGNDFLAAPNADGRDTEVDASPEAKPSLAELLSDDEASDGVTSGAPVRGALVYEETEDPPTRDFDEDRARHDARREMARRGYRGFCTSDCSGHEAGYQWAYENRLSRPTPTFDSPSFDEGQEAFVKDVKRRLEEKREAFEADPESSDYAE